MFSLFSSHLVVILEKGDEEPLGTGVWEAKLWWGWVVQEDGLSRCGSRREWSCQHEGLYFFDKNLEINKEKKPFPMLVLSYDFEEGVCRFTGVFAWATSAFIFYWRDYHFPVDLSRKHFKVFLWDTKCLMSFFFWHYKVSDQAGLQSMLCWKTLGWVMPQRCLLQMDNHSIKWILALTLVSTFGGIRIIGYINFYFMLCKKQILARVHFDSPITEIHWIPTMCQTSAPRRQPLFPVS